MNRAEVLIFADGDVVGVVECVDEITASALAVRLEEADPDIATIVWPLDAKVARLEDVEQIANDWANGI